MYNVHGSGTDRGCIGTSQTQSCGLYRSVCLVPGFLGFQQGAMKRSVPTRTKHLPKCNPCWILVEQKSAGVTNYRFWVVWLPWYFGFCVLSLLFVKINYVYISKYERLPKSKTALGLEIQPSAVQFIPFVNQRRHLLILYGFRLMIWEMIKF
jgi:hypothetical protein